MPALLVAFLTLAGGGPGTDYLYACDSSSVVMAQFEDNYMHLRQGRESIILVRAVSGSGARYTDGKTVFWIKGRNATYDDGNGVVRKCRVMDRG